jgi:hypothetical protein
MLACCTKTITCQVKNNKFARQKRLLLHDAQNVSGGKKAKLGTKVIIDWLSFTYYLSISSLG